MSLIYQVISEAEWRAAAPVKAEPKRRGRKSKTVLLRKDSNGIRYYGRESCDTRVG